MPTNIAVTEQIGIGFGSIGAREMTQAEAEAEAAEVAEFRKVIDWRNPAICIDGRQLASGETALPLGAHMAGGAETVIVAAKSVGIELPAEELLAKLSDQRFVIGAHVADTNKAANYEGGTGCGACDKCEGNCGLFAEHKAAVAGTVEALMGEDEAQSSELYHAMTAFQVATYLGLCDGTHRAAVLN